MFEWLSFKKPLSEYNFWSVAASVDSSRLKLSEENSAVRLDFGNCSNWKKSQKMVLIVFIHPWFYLMYDYKNLSQGTQNPLVIMSKI